MKKYFILIALYFSVFSTLDSFGYNYAASSLKRRIEKREKSGKYNDIHLSDKNFSGENLSYMSLESIRFCKANLQRTRLDSSYIS